MDLVNNFLVNELKLKQDDKIVIGVSAGPDSMFLLYLLIELQKKIGFKIIVAHINHNVRKESLEECNFLKNYCLEHKVLFNSIEIKKYDHSNFHQFARNFRYNFYHKLIKKYNANYLLTAHHGDDLIETILMRLTRGSTISGYSGIQLIRKLDSYKIVRPLLYMTKSEIKDFDDKLGIPYRIDKSNESSKYTRNRYRMNILPFLKSENQNVHLKFLKFSSYLSEIDNYLDKNAIAIYNQVYINHRLNINLLLNIDLIIIKRVLEYVLKDIYSNLENILDKHIEMLLKLIYNNQTGKQVNLPDNIIAVVEYGYLNFINKTINEDYFYELKDGLVLKNGMKFINIENNENGNDTLHLDSSVVKLPLYVRNKRNGDFIELKGIKGKKKVSDIFIDSKIIKSERNSYPVVVDSFDRIIWIPKLKKSKYDSQNHEKCDIIIKCL